MSKSNDDSCIEKNTNLGYTEGIELRLTNDFIFKYVFGREDNSPRLLTLVNAVLEDVDFPRVTTLEIKNSELPKDAHWLHSSVLDIRAIDENGHGYDIEIQLGHKEQYEYRSMYYGSKLYDTSFKRAEEYSELKPIVCISFVDFDLFEGEEDFHSCFVPTEIKRKHLMLLNGVRMHFIEMKKAKGKNGKLAELVRLLLEIKPQPEEEMKELLEKNPVYEDIYGDYLHCIEDEQTRHDAISREKWLRDYKHDMSTSHRKGLKEGIEQGLLSSAKKALQKGIDTDTIAEITGLSEEQIKQLM